MLGILDHMMQQPDAFRPQSSQEFFAMQLARRLQDTANIRKYVLLADQYDEDILVQAYRRALETRIGDPLAERFDVELRRVTRRIKP